MLNAGRERVNISWTWTDEIRSVQPINWLHAFKNV